MGTSKKDEIVLYNSDSLVREAHEFTEASYSFNIWEERIFSSALTKIKPNDEDFKEYRIYIREMVLEQGIKTNTAYEHIRKAAETLRKKKVTIPYRFGNDEGTFTTGIIVGYGEAADDDLAYVTLELHPKLKPYFLQLKETYTQYNLLFVMRMQSGYSRRIYRLLKQYEKIGKRYCSVEKLKEMMCIGENEYKQYYDFKRRVILKAQKDLKKYTDIQFSFEEHKRGRRVMGITFFISLNKDVLAIEKQKTVDYDLVTKVDFEETAELTDSQQELLDDLSWWGINKDTLLEYLKHRSEAHIRACIAETKQAKHVRNEVKYFISLLRKKEIVSSTEFVTRKNEQKKKEKQARAKQEAAFKEALNQLRNQKYQLEQKTVEALLTDESLLEQVKEKVSHKVYAKYEEHLSFEENWAKSSVRIAVHNIMLTLVPEAFEEINYSFDTKIKSLKQKYGM